MLMIVLSCSRAHASYVGRSKPHKFSFFGFFAVFAPSAAIK